MFECVCLHTYCDYAVMIPRELPGISWESDRNSEPRTSKWGRKSENKICLYLRGKFNNTEMVNNLKSGISAAI